MEGKGALDKLTAPSVFLKWKVTDQDLNSELSKFRIQSPCSVPTESLLKIARTVLEVQGRSNPRAHAHILQRICSLSSGKDKLAEKQGSHQTHQVACCECPSLRVGAGSIDAHPTR